MGDLTSSYEYGLRYSFQGGAVESIVITPGLAAAEHCLLLVRRMQKILDMPVDATLTTRTPETRTARHCVPAGDWREVIVDYGMSYTRRGAHAPSVLRVRDRPSGAAAVRVMRQMQAALGDPVDARLVVRHGERLREPAGPWCAAIVEPDVAEEIDESTSQV